MGSRPQGGERRTSNWVWLDADARKKNARHAVNGLGAVMTQRLDVHRGVHGGICPDWLVIIGLPSPSP
jgi:hypothetical protein